MDNTVQNEKQNLVDAILMLERAEVIDFNGHFSARTGPDSFLINSANSSRSALTVEDIIAVNLDGTPLEGDTPPPMEFHIHAEIYQRSPEVRAVVHTHPLWSTVLGIAKQKIRPVIMQAAVLGEIRNFPKIASINTRALAAELADTLGEARIIMLQSHGAVIVGETVTEAFVLAIYLEETARRQYMAAQIGDAITLSHAEIEVIGKNLRKPHLFKKVWDYHKGKMPRI
jgi:ribulose-5-phosphate 4-epimerase/fuculose-1-phosphate aldolase